LTTEGDYPLSITLILKFSLANGSPKLLFPVAPGFPLWISPPYSIAINQPINPSIKEGRKRICHHHHCHHHIMIKPPPRLVKPLGEGGSVLLMMMMMEWVVCATQRFCPPFTLPYLDGEVFEDTVESAVDVADTILTLTQTHKIGGCFRGDITIELEEEVYHQS